VSLPSRLGKRTAWTVAVLAAAACLLVAEIGPLQSADIQKAPGNYTPAPGDEDEASVLQSADIQKAPGNNPPS
jgi:hypothetical protein